MIFGLTRGWMEKLSVMELGLDQKRIWSLDIYLKSYILKKYRRWQDIDDRILPGTRIDNGKYFLEIFAFQYSRLCEKSPILRLREPDSTSCPKSTFL